jgi:hypothetical protein
MLLKGFNVLEAMATKHVQEIAQGFCLVGEDRPQGADWRNGNEENAQGASKGMAPVH